MARYTGCAICVICSIGAAMTLGAAGPLTQRAGPPPMPAGVMMSNGDLAEVNYHEFERRSAMLFADAGVDSGTVYPLINIVSTPKGDRMTAIIEGKPRILAVNPDDVEKLDAGEMLHLESLGQKYGFDPKTFGASPDAAVARLPSTIARRANLAAGVRGPRPGPRIQGVHEDEDEADVGHVHGAEAGVIHHQDKKDTTVVFMDPRVANSPDQEDGIGYEGEAPDHPGFIGDDGATPEVQDGEVSPGQEQEYEVDHEGNGLLSRRPGFGGPGRAPAA